MLSIGQCYSIYILMAFKLNLNPSCVDIAKTHIKTNVIQKSMILHFEKAAIESKKNIIETIGCEKANTLVLEIINEYLN